MRENKQNWFPTLNSALQSEGLIDYWPLGTNINYDSTVSVTVECGKKIKYISVTRDNQGRYERPIHYFT